MSEVALRIGKAFLIAAVTFWSVWAISGSAKISFAVAMIPMLFGSLAILSELAYGLAGLSLLVAVGLQVIPSEWIAAGRDLGEKVVVGLDKSK